MIKRTLTLLALTGLLLPLSAGAGELVVKAGTLDAVNAQGRTVTMDGVVVQVPRYLGDLT